MQLYTEQPGAARSRRPSVSCLCCVCVWHTTRREEKREAAQAPEMMVVRRSIRQGTSVESNRIDRGNDSRRYRLLVAPHVHSAAAW